MKMFISIFLPLFISLTASAHEADLFHKLVMVQRDEKGVLTQLVIREAAQPGALVLRDRYVRDILAFSQRSSDLNMLNTELDQAGWSDEEKTLLKETIKKLKNSSQITAALKNKDFTDILRKFELDLLNIFAFQVLASPSEPGYYHANTMIQLAIDSALKIAGHILGSVPLLDALGFLLERTIQILEERRSFYQNVVLHYLENYPPEFLGLTAQEVAWVKSSIYESRIAWYDFDTAEDAKKQWATFGSEIFADKVARGEDRLKKNAKKYDKFFDKFNFAYIPAQKKNSFYIVDLINKRNKLSTDLSVAYDFDKPKKIKTIRMAIQAVQIASRFSPMPGLALRAMDWLLDSYYIPQKNTEGSLYAYLMIHGRTSEAQIVVDQATNPLLSLELK